MFKFKLVEGNHTEDGNDYKFGDTIETKKDLGKAFPGRFQEIITKDVINIAPEAPNEPDISKTEAEKQVIKPKKAKRKRKKKAK